MRVGLLVIAALCAGCIEDDLVDCGNGVACPEDRVCDLAHAQCVAPEQLTVCAGLAPDADCDTGAISGGCFDGVCLQRGCGNGILETDESCDDGNQLSGDSCRNDCRSDESCGNGVLDPGEGCDDGNFVGGDGCDSTCRLELSPWSLTPLVPHCSAGAHDEARGVYVCVTNDSTWEHKAGHWTLVAAETIPSSFVYYDTGADRVAAVARASGALMTWNGATWSAVNSGIGATPEVVVFDPTRETPVAILLSGAVYTLDAGGAWQLEATGPGIGVPPSANSYTIHSMFGAYDEAAATLHLWVQWSESYDCDNCTYLDLGRRWDLTAGVWSIGVDCGYAPTCEQWPPSSTFIFDTIRDRLLLLSNGRPYAYESRSRIRRIDASTNKIELLTSSGLNAPNSIALAIDGTMYIADTNSHRILRRTTAGTITTFAGTGTPGYSGDDGPAIAAQLSYPRSVEVDAAGVVYVADSSNHRIRRIDTAGTITTIAGNGTGTSTGDDGAAIAATVYFPGGLAVKGTDLYFCEPERIRKIDADGTITKVVGGGPAGFGGDGGSALLARVYNPSDIAFDADGNLYIADTNNYRVRRVTGGAITTVAGSGGFGYFGDGGPATSARLTYPQGVAIDAAGNLLIADAYNRRIRRVTGTTITTVVGTSQRGGGGDGGPANEAELWNPMDVDVDAAGNIHLAGVGGDAWLALGPRSNYSLSALAYFDEATDEVITQYENYQLAWKLGAWSRRDVDAPARAVLVGDPPAGVLAYDFIDPGPGLQASRSWYWAGSRWVLDEATPLPGPHSTALLAYDWVREAPVLFGAQTFVRGTSGWSLIDATTRPAPTALAFDPELPGLIADTGGTLLALPSTATAWTSLGTTSALAGVLRLGSFARV